MKLTARKHRLRALTVEYHGIANRELEAAGEIAEAAGIDEHRFVRLPDLREAGDIQAALFPGMPSTYIPMRNSIFYSLAASYAEEVGAELIVGGHNKDDVKTFPDATPVFFEGLQSAFRVGSPTLRRIRTRIQLPLSGKTKAEVVRFASRVGVPLALTWSCHRDGRSHCWECDGCRSRASSFEAAGVVDPLGDASKTGKIS